MRPFCETSSSAKTLTNDKAIGRALHSSRFPMIDGYEVRKYDTKGEYRVIKFFTSKQAARVFKSFFEIEHGPCLAIVACKNRYHMALSKAELDYMKSDVKLVQELVDQQ